jgi:hypothetical protein
MIRNCRRCGESFESDRNYHRLCWPCYWDQRNAAEANERQTPPAASAAAQGPALDPRLLRDAIALCHPDRHPPERSKTANAVTAALLDLLKAARGAA